MAPQPTLSWITTLLLLLAAVLNGEYRVGDACDGVM